MGGGGSSPGQQGISAALTFLYPLVCIICVGVHVCVSGVCEGVCVCNMLLCVHRRRSLEARSPCNCF